jgi:HAD superfamily hydrolase (TIGR01509 family)
LSQSSETKTEKINLKMNISHVIFDMDGILIETESVYSKVTLEILKKFGISEFPWSVKSKMMGQKSIDAARILIAEMNLPMTPEEYVLERDKMHECHFPHCEYLPGVLRLVKHLKQHNIPIAVATSSHKAAFLLKSKFKTELFELFESNIICGDDPRVKRGKPSGDIFIEASKLIGAVDCPKNVLVFEDSPSGMLAGLDAGIIPT